MAKTLYTLLESKNTGEFHLFESQIKNSTCMVNKTSICGKMDYADMAKVIFSCKDEDSARLECAKYGRKVCGICVSHLYGDLE